MFYRHPIRFQERRALQRQETCSKSLKRLSSYKEDNHHSMRSRGSKSARMQRTPLISYSIPHDIQLPAETEFFVTPLENFVGMENSSRKGDLITRES